MKTEFIDVSPTRKQLVFEIPPDVVETELERVARTYGRSARIPGFRPGKAPTRLVRQRFKDQILHDAMHDLIPRAIDEALRDHAVEPIDAPDVREVSLDEGQPLRFVADFETVPPIEPVDYDSLTLRRSTAALPDDAVDRSLERLRERNARHEPVEDRPSRHGDVLTVDLTRRELRPAAEAGAAKGASPAPAEGVERHENVTIEIGGAANPPGFDAEMTDLPAGGEKTFTIAFPADHPVSELAGREVEYTVVVKAIKRRVLPELDDEFAKDLGEFDSLDALRERVRADLQGDAARSQDREMRADLLRQLASRVAFDAPDALIDREVDRRIEELARQLMEQGIDPMRAGIEWDELRARQREGARESVKSLLVLDDIARREGITVTEADVEAEVVRLAERAGRRAAAIRAVLEKEGGLARLRVLLRRDRTVEFLLGRVTIVSV